MHQVRSEDGPAYNVTPAVDNDDEIVRRAFAILARRTPVGRAFHTPGAVREFLVLRAATQDDQYRERFGVLWLDSQNRMIAFCNMFDGTLSQTSVYPREIVRTALHHNAAAAIFTHNHPSGAVEPSRADEHLTQTLKSALALVDVKVIDHIITSPNGNSLSMAEKGLI
jgi:DNA repair protein RadC